MKRMIALTAGLLSCLMILSCSGCRTQSSPAENGSSVVSGVTQNSTEERGKSEELPNASNDYLVAEKMNQDVTVDLDGDGKLDTLKVSIKKRDTSDGTSDWIEYVLNSIVINGNQLAEPDAENTLQAYQIYLESPDEEQYFITDLDSSDKALEIALLDYGPSDDPVTWYLHYKDGELESLGSLPGFPDDEDSQRDGNGNVMAVGRLSLLQTWCATFPYTMKNGKLAEVPQSQYIPLQDPAAVVTLKRGLTVYAKPDQKADTTQIEPSQEPVTFLATDNKHWVQIHMTDGTEGWIYCKDFSTIVSGGRELAATDVFDHLVLAD